MQNTIEAFQAALHTAKQQRAETVARVIAKLCSIKLPARRIRAVAASASVSLALTAVIFGHDLMRERPREQPGHEAALHTSGRSSQGG